MTFLTAARARLDAYPVHAWTLVVVAAAILVVPTRGAVPSLVTGLVIAVGLATLLDRRDGPALVPAARPLAALLAALVAWQALGVLWRAPFDAEDAAALPNALAIALLLPVTVAAARRDPRALETVLRALFVLGSVCAVVSLVQYGVALARSPEPFVHLRSMRLEPFGRARHAIIGAGGLVAAGLAGLALLRAGAIGRRALAWAGLAAIGLAVLLTQSRGPVLALLLALLGLLGLERLRPSARPAAAVALGLACYAVPVALVTLEPWITRLVCSGDTGLCRPSQRFDMWMTLARMIPDQPLFGYGPSLRLGADTVGHAHNGLIGATVYFGLPATALLLAAMGLGLARAARLGSGAVRTFCLAGLLFAAGFLGSDLPNPFGFLNAHFLFLWLPLVVAVAASVTPGLSPRRP